MSIELIDKEVSTEDLDAENVEKKEIQDENSKEEEKKETTDLEKLEAVLSVLVENKVTSIRNCEKKVKEKKLLLKKFHNNKFEEPHDGRIQKIRTNSSTTLASSSKYDCHQNECSRSLIPETDSSYYHHHHRHHHHYHHHHHHHHHLQSNPLYPRRSFESYGGSLFYKPTESLCCEHGTDSEQRLNRKKFPLQKCLPKQLSTEQWLNSTSRQTSTETATTSSGYISPTFGGENKKHRSQSNESDVHQVHPPETTSNGGIETIIDMSKIQAQKILDTIEESKSIDEMLTEPQASGPNNELKRFRVNNSSSKGGGAKCNESCHAIAAHCVSTTCLPTCRYAMVEDQECHSDAPYRHLHPSGGHYMSCYNSPTHSFRRFQYDENYLTLAMNLEDLEFEQEEERRKRRKRRKKRQKERQIRARGLMADELKSVKKASKVLDPEDLPKRARWTIVATACLLLLMSMLLVGVTLRMAPIIDEMVRKENEEMLHSLSRQEAVKGATDSLNVTKSPHSELGNSSNRF